MGWPAMRWNSPPPGVEYEYVLDAATGQILSRWQEPEHRESGRR